MFGYACDETPELMPATLQYSHDILRRLAEVRHSRRVPRPGARRQEPGHPALRGRPAGRGAADRRLDPAHDDRPDLGRRPRRWSSRYIRRGRSPTGLITKKTKWHVNPTGRFEIGGPDGDAGLTGRKIIVDTYGGAAPHGGGAFSGKDPTKVDRSAAYACRYLAKNVVAAGLAKRCTIQISYAIGVAQPLSLLRRPARHRRDRPGEAGEGPAGADRRRTPRAIREHLRPQPADLRPHRRLRPLRPPARQRGRLLLGDAPTWPTSCKAAGLSLTRPSIDRMSPVVARSAAAILRMAQPLRAVARQPGESPEAHDRSATRRCAPTAACKTPRHQAAAGGAAGEPAAGIAVPARPGRSIRRADAGGDEVWLEIGFGGGEHLAAQARGQPRRRADRLRALRERRREGAAPHRRRQAIGNVRLHHGDARELIELLPTPRSTGSSCSSPTPGPRPATIGGAS